MSVPTTSRPTTTLTSVTNNLFSNPSESSMRFRNRRVSSYDASLMPVECIKKRELHSFSVHFSPQTLKWIATLARAEEAPGPQFHPRPEAEKRRCTSFSFPSEREARKFAKEYSPPKLQPEATKCTCCAIPFDAKHKACHCRNCGVQICDKCSARWAVRMIPKTYLCNNASLTVRVCKSCDWLSNAFCMALLQGNYPDALRFHSTGNINLRCTFADIQKEAMFPIHCAVLGGNIDLVKWLIEAHDCPISVRRDPRSGMFLSIQTSKSRTLIDLAMTGRPKIDILSYLVRRNLSVVDTKDPSLAPKTLQTLMGAGFRFEQGKDGDNDSLQLVDTFSDHASVATVEDACIICCEKNMDCVLTPCGHQICCSDCGAKLVACPVCKQQSRVLKIFRM